MKQSKQNIRFMTKTEKEQHKALRKQRKNARGKAWQVA